jgi:hypothetical protein
MLLSAAELKIDHVTVCGSNLQTMQSKLGMKSEFGGAHSNHATEMAITSFPDGSYLELIAIQKSPDPKAVDAHYWTPYMKGESGPCAWAVRTNDVGAEVARLKKAGIAVSDPQKSGRTKPDGFRLEWETANVGTEPNGTFFPFIIRDFTDRDKRAFVSGHPTSTEYTGIRRVVIAVRDLSNGVERYRKAYSLPAPTMVKDSKLGDVAVFEGTPVAITAAARDRVAKFGEGPCAFLLGKAAAKSWSVKWITPGWLGDE